MAIIETQGLSKSFKSRKGGLIEAVRDVEEGATGLENLVLQEF